MDSVYKNLTPEHFSAGLLWLERMSQSHCWNLSHEQTAALLGMSSSEYGELTAMARQQHQFMLTTEQTERLSLLLGLWKRLQLLSTSRDAAASLFNIKNTGHFLAGQSIRTYLLEKNSIQALYAANNYLESIISSNI